MDRQFYIETPLIESGPLAETINCGKVLLKLENTQPSGSFKLRGISNFILQEVKRGKTKLVASSGGNAGLAAAYTARRLDVPLMLIVPTSTKPMTIERLRGERANVIVHGKIWNDSDRRAREEVKDEHTAYIHPFDHPHVWEGHGNMIVEVASQLKVKPNLIVLCVGGGGLLLGVCNGMSRVGWADVPILAVETKGADSFHQADLLDRVVTVNDTSSIAATLITTEVAEEAVRARKRHKIISQVVSDRDAVIAICRFLDDHRILVEPSCGASLAAFYSNLIRDLQYQGSLASHLENVVVIVCGGSGVTMEMLEGWKKMFDIKL